MVKKLPIGIQGFEKLISDHFLYVDKTDLIYELVHKNVPYFLSRPRRFGKSLLLSTLRAYWEGKRELFEGLKIEQLEADHSEAWQPYPVFYFDFNGKNYQEPGMLETELDNQLRVWERQFGIQDQDRTLDDRFLALLGAAFQQTGKRCVVLVDEYDKPLLETLDDPELGNHNKGLFRSFFSILKKADEWIQFVFITGVTKFEKVSIFSDMNQLRDISMSRDFAGICGITEDELHVSLQPYLRELAQAMGLTDEECLDELKRVYDGYRFQPDGPRLFNPFSLLNAFADGEMGSYWFSTGTPTFLVKLVSKSGFDLRKFTDRTLYANESMLSEYRADNPDVVPLLYQTGYLTIVDFDRKRKRYTLAFPNEEVKYGFLESLAPAYTHALIPGKGKDIYSLDECVEKGDLDGIKNIFTALFASIPYTSLDHVFEYNFQSVIYIVFELLGQFVQCERHSSEGRVDCIVETDRFIYLFEFKRDETAAEALKQIEEQNYARPYAADARKLYKIGVGFSSETRNISDWQVV